MACIFKITPDARGGYIAIAAVEPDTLKSWSSTIDLEIAVENSDAYRGKDIPLAMDIVPRTFVLKKPRPTMPDMCWVENGLLLISDDLRKIIERLDPGKHHIWPVTILSKRGVPRAEVFHAIVPNVHASSLSETQSDVYVKEAKLMPAVGNFAANISPRTARLHYTYDAAYRPTKTPDSHLWWDHALTDPYLLLSDALHDAIKAADLKTIPMKKLRVAKTAA